MDILIVHPSFPGQYYYLARYLAQAPENRVLFLCKENSINTNLPGVNMAIYKPPPQVPEGTHHYVGTALEAILEGQQTVRALDAMSREGFKPDIIIGHAGWGNLMYSKDVFPEVPVIGYMEWYYHSQGTDSYYWPGEKPEIDMAMTIRTKNMHHLLTLDTIDLGITPTKWQLSQFPTQWHSKMRVQHEGTDTEWCSPAPKGKNPKKDLHKLKENGKPLKVPEDATIITYVSRGFEPIRGFPQFMDAIRHITAARKDVHVLIAGTDRVCYTNGSPDGKSYKQIEEEKGEYDKKRVHFLGSLNRGDYQTMLRASDCHVYLTRPFILSWSMLEAMSFGVPLVSSATPPVMEMVEDNVTGLLAEFRSPMHIAHRIDEVLGDKELAEKIGKNAREFILENYDVNKCLRRMEDIMYECLR